MPRLSEMSQAEWSVAASSGRSTLPGSKRISKSADLNGGSADHGRHTAIAWHRMAHKNIDGLG
jgi:hypothetical protein